MACIEQELELLRDLADCATAGGSASTMLWRQVAELEGERVRCLRGIDRDLACVAAAAAALRAGDEELADRLGPEGTDVSG